MGLYTASRVTPLALALVHRSCPVTAEVYSATGGHYCRFAISHTDGAVLGLEPTVEDVVTRFDEIRGAGTVPNEVDGEALVWARSRSLRGCQDSAPTELSAARTSAPLLASSATAAISGAR
jgi:hypothetical protein